MTHLTEIKINLAFALLFFLCLQTAFCRTVNETNLPSGIKILTYSDEESKTSSVNIWVKAGSADESQGEEGISHFLEHLFFRGTDNQAGNEFKARIEKLGGEANAETSKDYTRYFINVPSENTLKALNLLIETIKNAAFKKEELDIERKVILEEYNLTNNNPERAIYDELMKSAYPNHPYSKPVIGYKENIEKFQRNDFLSYREKFYKPSNLIFIITGSFHEQDAINLISKAYSNSSGHDSVKRQSVVKLTKPDRKIIKYKGPSITAMGFYAPSAEQKRELCATDALCFMLGMGKSSFFNKLQKSRKENIENISLDFQTMKEPGLIVITATYKNIGEDEIKKLIMGEINKISSGEFTQADLSRAKNMLVNSYIFSNETNAGFAESLGIYSVLNDYKFALNYVESIRKLSKEDIIKAAETLKQGPICEIIYASDKK